MKYLQEIHNIHLMNCSVSEYGVECRLWTDCCHCMFSIYLMNSYLYIKLYILRIATTMCNILVVERQSINFWKSGNANRIDLIEMNKFTAMKTKTTSHNFHILTPCLSTTNICRYWYMYIYFNNNCSKFQLNNNKSVLNAHDVRRDLMISSFQSSNCLRIWIESYVEFCFFGMRLQIQSCMESIFYWLLISQTLDSRLRVCVL